MLEDYESDDEELEVGFAKEAAEDDIDLEGASVGDLPL